jgi:hypothetical protein
MTNEPAKTVTEARETLTKNIGTLLQAQRMGFKQELIDLAMDSINDAINDLIKAAKREVIREEQAALALAATIADDQHDDDCTCYGTDGYDD